MWGRTEVNMLSDKWYQMWVKHETANPVALMIRCYRILQRFTSVPCAPEGRPVLEGDGTIEVRSYNESGFHMAKRYLKEQGFVIVREKENSSDGGETSPIA